MFGLAVMRLLVIVSPSKNVLKYALQQLGPVLMMTAATTTYRHFHGLYFKNSSIFSSLSVLMNSRCIGTQWRDHGGGQGLSSYLPSTHKALCIVFKRYTNSNRVHSRTIHRYIIQIDISIKNVKLWKFIFMRSLFV